VEDGSQQNAETIIAEFKDRLPLVYLRKENTGPGDSRNYGMARASGNYFVILDSDCLVTPQYLEVVERALETHYVDCYGGPDAAHHSFTSTQKAINYAMTSVLTTGGIRGGKRAVGRFQPRSFNMGLSKKAFETTGGFGNIHPGEDPDLSMRLWKMGFTSRLIPEAYVYHKRRIDLNKFFRQMKKFGMVRPILNKWHPAAARITYWFPTLFCLGFLASLLLLVFASYPYNFMLIGLYVVYLGLIFCHALIWNRNLTVAFLSIAAVIIQFISYGFGFLKSTILVNFDKRKPQEIFPELFFE
jgi:GT2 family glycosyltransferase